ncbi:MAG: hypothetical protein ABSE49_16410 [Polyangiaceae bacterium]
MTSAFTAEVLDMNRPVFVRRTVFGLALAGVAALASTAGPAFAQDHASRLPAELYAACASKSAGTACTAALRGRELHGVCSSDRNEPALSCRPAPPRPRS